MLLFSIFVGLLIYLLWDLGGVSVGKSAPALLHTTLAYISRPMARNLGALIHVFEAPSSFEVCTSVCASLSY